MVAVPAANAWYPQDHGDLIDNAVRNQAIAGKALSPVSCSGYQIGFPVLDSDPDVSWYAPGATITETDAGTSELIVQPKAAKGLSRVSNESLTDSDPAVAEVIGAGLARQIIEKVDSALFAATVPVNGPQGLMAYAYTSIEATNGVAAVTNEDLFVDAKFTALENGAELSAFVLATDVAKALAKVKVATSDSRRLLDHDAEGNLTIAGLPAFVSRHVAAGEAWGIDKSQVFLVIRKGTEVELDRSAAFAADSTLVRAVMRTNFAVTNPAGVIRLWNDPAIV